MYSLDFLGPISGPIPEQLAEQNAIGCGSETVGQNDHLVPGLLDRSEDAGSRS